MGDTENSHFKWALGKLGAFVYKVFRLLSKTPMGSYIDLLKGYKDDYASNNGLALGVLLVIVYVTNSEVVLLAVVANIFYIVYKGYENKGEDKHTCPTCDEGFDTHHGLKVHTGKKHSD